MHSTSLTQSTFLYVFISSHLAHSRCRWHTHLINHNYFDCRKTPNTPMEAPCQEEKSANALYPWSKSVKNPDKLYEMVNHARGVTFAKIVHGCACLTPKIWLSLYQVFAQLPTHQYTIFDRKAPNFAQIGCFLQWFAQNTPTLFFNLGSFICDENPPIAIPNFAKKHLNR